MILKKTVLVFLMLITTLSSWSQKKIEWMSMNDALAAQKKKPKKILMDVYTTWCGPCKLMDQRTFGNKDVIQFVNENFYPVKFNAEGTEEIMYNNFLYTNPNYVAARKGRNSQHFLAHALKINSYPSIVFFDKNASVIAPVGGYLTPQQLEIYLRMITTDKYKELTTTKAWKAYEKDFKPTFK